MEGLPQRAALRLLGRWALLAVDRPNVISRLPGIGSAKTIALHHAWRLEHDGA